MKFEKFLKMTAGKGVIIDHENGEKWLLFDGVLMRIPDGVNVIAALRMETPKFVENIINAIDSLNVSTAELTNAILPEPDASASKIVRIWKDVDGGEIGIENKYFGIIEKDNSIMTAYDNEYDPDTPAALLIVTGYGDNEEIEGIIFDKDYLTEKINERK